MKITIKEVSGHKPLKTFIHLPAKIHKGHTNWVPPIYMDEWTFFNSKKNKSFEYCDTVLALAYRNNVPVGRIMGIISHKYNQKHNENYGRFAFVDTYNDQEVFHSLISFIANWAKQKGMEKLVGPFCFSDKDPQGFMIEGFDETVVLASNYNFPYMVSLTENEGFTKKADLVVYQIKIPATDPPVYNKIYERFQQNHHNLKVLEFTSRRKVKPYIRPVLSLVNKTFTDIYGFVPFTEKEMHDFANRYLYLINPRYIKIVVEEKTNKVVSFIIGMSDLSKGIQKSKGFLIPFGFIHLIASGFKTSQLNLLIGAIHPSYQGKGLDVVMGVKMLKAARETGKTTIDSHLELEYNTKVRAEMEKVGGKVYKRYRIFQKDL